MAHIIVIGNEKGGSGKSTTSMHIATALSVLGKEVGVLDLDLRQTSLGRYLQNRKAYMEANNLELPLPDYLPLPKINEADIPEGEHISDHRLSAALEILKPTKDFILIDCPGSHTRLSQMAHAMADTLVTPLNDSFVDFDMLARVDPTSGKILGPSIYSTMVWNTRQSRAQAGLKALDWIVVRNRIATQRMHNKRRIEDSLKELSKRIGFRLVAGFGERVIFRELFPQGLTLLDARTAGIGGWNLSNVAARQEIRDLINELKLPNVKANF